MPVTTLHPRYEDHAKEWRRTEDAVIGPIALKKRNHTYLPAHYAEEEPKRYEEYTRGAYYVNYTLCTESVLSGMVYRKDPIVELPVALEYLLDDFDGAGNSIVEVSKDALSQRLRKNRYLFLADYSGSSDGLTSEQEKALGLRPTVSTYHAESLINWKFATVNGSRKLVLAVLKEARDVSLDEFGHECEPQYRVLRLENGIYTQEVVDQSENVLVEKFMPMMGAVKGSREAKPFDHIPLSGVRELGVAPLQPIAEINLAHYQDTAVLQDTAKVAASPSMHIDTGETSASEFKEANGAIRLGIRNAILTKGGRIEMVQPDERPLIRVVREDKAAELAAIGAAIVTSGGQAETAEAARIRAGTETSQLDSVVSDLSADIQDTLRDQARFAGYPDPDGITFNLNTEFFDKGMTPDKLRAILEGQILYGRNAALDMIRSGTIEIPDGKTNDDLLADAATVIPDGSLM